MVVGGLGIAHLSWHIKSLEMRPVFLVLYHFLPDLCCYHVLVCKDKCVVAYINHQDGLRLCPLFRLAQQVLLWADGKLLSLRVVYILGHFGSRRPVDAGAEAQGLATPTLNSGAHMAEVWPGGSGLVYLRGVNPLSPLVLSPSSSYSGTGCHGCLSSDCSAPGRFGEGLLERDAVDSGWHV